MQTNIFAPGTNDQDRYIFGNISLRPTFASQVVWSYLQPKWQISYSRMRPPSYFFGDFGEPPPPPPAVIQLKIGTYGQQNSGRFESNRLRIKVLKSDFRPLLPSLKNSNPHPRKSIDSKKGRRRILAQCLCSAEICCGTVIPCHRYV